MDGTNVLGLERDGYQLYKQPIQELFVLKGTLRQINSFVRFEIDFDFKLISFLILDGSADIGIYVSLDKNPNIRILSAGISGQAGAKTDFDNSYFPKGCVVEIHLTNDPAKNIPFIGFIQQVNFIDYASS
jgi:hypothetical protein